MFNEKQKMTIPPFLKDILNQIFEIEKKSLLLKEPNTIQRNINRIKDLYKYEMFPAKEVASGVEYINLLGESYDETRTDCEASISGETVDNLVIIDVLKPKIVILINGENIMIQKAIVIVETNKNEI